MLVCTVFAVVAGAGAVFLVGLVLARAMYSHAENRPMAGKLDYEPRRPRHGRTDVRRAVFHFLASALVFAVVLAIAGYVAWKLILVTMWD